MDQIPSTQPAQSPSATQPHLFVVRVWWEPDGRAMSGEWRASIEHVATREKRYIRDLAALPEFVGRQVGWPAGPAQSKS